MSPQEHRHLTRMAEIVESSPDAIFSTSPDGRVETWNHAAERLLGYSADEIVGQPLAIVIPPALSIWADDVIARVQHGERVIDETQLRRKNGLLVWVSVTLNPVHDTAGELVALSGSFQDITKRKDLEQHFADSERRLRIAFGDADLVEITAAFAEATSDLSGLFEAVARLVSERMADGCMITLVGAKEHRPAAIAIRHPDAQIGTSLEQSLTRTGAILENSAGPAIGAHELVERATRQLAPTEGVALDSLLITPMQAGDDFLGVLCAIRDSSSQPFTDQDRWVFDDLAQCLASAVVRTHTLHPSPSS